MTDRQKLGSASMGLVYGLLVGWVVGIVWWTFLVIIFGLQPAVTVVIVDSTGRQETRVTVLERIALIPVRNTVGCGRWRSRSGRWIKQKQIRYSRAIEAP